MGSINADVSESDDAELATRAQCGDHAAFAALAEQHYGALLRLLLGMTQDPDLAADLTQETFLAAQKHLPQLANTSSFVPWLHQIARNLFRQELRCRHSERLVSLDWLVDDELAVPSSLRCADISDSCALRLKLQQAFDLIEPQSRRMLILHNVDGVPIEAIATFSGLSSDAVRKRITRAKSALCRQLVANR